MNSSGLTISRKTNVCCNNSELNLNMCFPRWVGVVRADRCGGVVDEGRVGHGAAVLDYALVRAPLTVALGPVLGLADLEPKAISTSGST